MSMSPDLMGRVVADRYRIDASIARGGMSTVYRARDLRLERDVALKVLAPAYATDPNFADRFLAEARAVAGLSHPNLVHVYDTGTDGDLRFIVMELLDGYRSLRSILERDGPLPVDAALRLTEQLLAGLAAVHSHGLIHSDVKPGNLMVGSGPAKLIDFGIARTPQREDAGETTVGSLHAMPPEQLRGEPLTAASDLFAAGAVLYSALTGRVPYPGHDPQAVLAAEEAADPVPPSALVPGVPPALDAAVAQAIDPRPARRFQSAAAMSHALRGAMRSGAAAPTEPRVAVAPRRDPRRRSWLPLLAVLTVVAGLAAVVAIGLGSARDGGARQSPRPSATATLAPGTVRVPNTIGLSEAQGEAAARRAGLSWTIRWQKTNEHAPGIYDQVPPANDVVDRGSRFTMYAYRPLD